ncbi:MAG TPA: RNA polymerase sigma factor [Pyrinomonadaceae bacterium]
MSNSSDNDNTEMFLVLRAQAGEIAAFDELLKLVQKALYRYIFHLVRHRQLSEDILQEVLLIIYRKIRWLDDPGLFRPWAYRIASRECFRQLKRQGRSDAQQLDEDVLHEAASDEVDAEYDPQLVALVPGLVAELSTESRAAVALHYLHEFSLRETAEILNISLGTAKSRVAYGLKTLRKKLSRIEESR